MADEHQQLAANVASDVARALYSALPVMATTVAAGGKASFKVTVSFGETKEGELSAATAITTSEAALPALRKLHIVDGQLALWLAPPVDESE